MNAKNGKIRAGIIGMGNWGRYGHVPVLRLLPDFEIVAVASRRKEYAEQTAPPTQMIVRTAHMMHRLLLTL